jgi:hypothetical protein
VPHRTTVYSLAGAPAYLCDDTQRVPLIPRVESAAVVPHLLYLLCQLRQKSDLVRHSIDQTTSVGGHSASHSE